MENNQLARFDKLKADVVLYTAPALKIIVSDKDSQAIAMDSVRQVVQWEKKVEETRKELIAPLLEAQRQINDYAKSLMEPLVNAKTHVKKELINWDSKLEVERQAELKRVQEEARSKEEYAKKVAAQAQSKLQEEARKKADELKEEQEAAALFGGSIEENKADMFEANSDNVRQSLILDAEEERTITNIASEARKEEKAVMANKVSGIKEVWKFEIVDIDLVPDNYWDINEAEIGRAVRGGVRLINGVRIYAEKTMAVR